jgi:hypothetical protein
MPVMTLNQAKMVLQIAGAYGQPISVERAKELFVVVGGAFAMRHIARQLVSLVPGIGFIIKAGIEMLSETLSDIIGQRADAEMSKTIKKLVAEEPEVRGAYDLILYNYGPDKNYGTLHMELPDTMSVEEVDVLTRKVQNKVFHETGVILTGIGVYSYNTSDDEAAQMRNHVQEKVLEHDWAIQMHGFYVDTVEKLIRFDVVLSFDADRKEALETLNAELREMYPDYTPVIVPDVDTSD